MSTFSEAALKEKLSGLSNSQQSIQTLSLWLIHHRKHARSIVKLWHAELQKTKISRKLLFVYLANDVVQNSKRKGQEFTKEFSTVMESAFIHVISVTDEKTKGSMERVCTIWADRGVFDATLIKQLQSTFVSPSNTPLDSPPPNEFEPASPKKPKTDPAEQMQKTMQELLKELNEEEPHIRNVYEILNTQHQAMLLWQYIFEDIHNKDSAEKLSTLVNDAVSMLTDYNGRLDLEMEERKRVLKMLRDYRLGQKDQLVAAEKKLEEYKQKLNKVTTVRKELKSHIQNLPDLTLLPDVTTGGLPPLPSTEVLVQCLRDLEHSASSDAAVREKIAKLPPEVQDVSLLERIKDKDSAEKLSTLVNDAVSMLTDYNGRLDLEMEERKRVLKMLRDYRLGQKDQLVAAEKKLEEYKQKLNKVTTVRKELKSHIQNLPDLTLLPDVTTGGLPPLPSAGDLFSIDT
ncbi:regulation of nuclear pre-mRNA domain-containing protein 1B-like [Anneissia japonica]|uniref:regulation of nuclear pre-mRNA domain-containing protein 1B-like n=1 Tax=Anneissia japonica TaxID=1529436 RepID=UPI0014259B74|nr:regulation of nuclear pre-mRNA domain-containing protein 1B-like [Anneissia japonica]